MPDETTVYINEFAFEKAFFAMFFFRLSWALTRWKTHGDFLRFLLIGVKAYQGWTQKIQEKGTESPTLPSPSPSNENFTFQDMQYTALWAYSTCKVR